LMGKWVCGKKIAGKKFEWYYRFNKHPSVDEKWLKVRPVLSRKVAKSKKYWFRKFFFYFERKYWWIRVFSVPLKISLELHIFFRRRIVRTIRHIFSPLHYICRRYDSFQIYRVHQLQITCNTGNDLLIISICC
jgi:hypothetical protein